MSPSPARPPRRPGGDKRRSEGFRSPMVPNTHTQRTTRRALKEFYSSSLAGPRRDDLSALIRCCIRSLPYLDKDDPRLAVRYRRRLFRTLRSVLSRDPSPSLLPTIEVFIENLASSNELRNFFTKKDSAAPEESRVFTAARQLNPELHIVLELLCNHFISALEDEDGFGAFLGALSRPGNDPRGAPEICFREASKLINSIHSISLPGVVQAHLLLLASRCVSGPDLDFHLPAFESSMNLYVDYLPALGVFNKCGSVENPWCPLSGKRPLTCYIKETTHQKLKNKVSGLLSFCQAHISDDMPISDGDIYDISHRLIEENQYLLHGKFRQEAILVIMSIVTKVLHCAKQKEVHEFDAEMTEEIISFAAVLRLMGSTLLEILNYFSRMRAADDNTNANHGQLRRDYSILCGKICLLSHYEANEPHRCDFISTIGEAVDRERASIQMLSHFASLSVFCVRRRLGFLWRLCIIMMMMAMNLVILEGQSMDIFQLLIDASKESADIPDTDKGSLPLALVPYTDKRNLQMQVYVARRSSRAIALQMGALQNRSDEKVDGQAFLRCHPDYKSSWNDLADFLECEKDKDYLNWLDQLKKFKDFKIGKYRKNSNCMKRKLFGNKAVRG